MITTQKQIRSEFWAAHPGLSRQRHRYSWSSSENNADLVYCVDTRCAFVDFVDYLQQSGQITESLANRATL